MASRLGMVILLVMLGLLVFVAGCQSKVSTIDPTVIHTASPTEVPKPTEVPPTLGPTHTSSVTASASPTEPPLLTHTATVDTTSTAQVEAEQSTQVAALFEGTLTALPTATSTLTPTVTPTTSSTATPTASPTVTVTQNQTATSAALQTRQSAEHAQIVGAVALTIAAYTPVPTQTSLPTYTLIPSPTVSDTPTPLPTPTQTPDVIGTYEAEAIQAAQTLAPTITAQSQTQIAQLFATQVQVTLDAQPTQTPLPSATPTIMPSATLAPSVTRTPWPTATPYTPTASPPPPTAAITLAPSSSAPSPDLFASATALVAPPEPSATVTLSRNQMTATQIITDVTATAAAWDVESFGVIVDVPDGWRAPQWVDANTLYLTDDAAQVFIYTGDAAYFEDRWGIPADENNLLLASRAVVQTVGGRRVGYDNTRQVVRIRIADEATPGMIYVIQLDEGAWVIVSASAPADDFEQYQTEVFAPLVNSLVASEADESGVSETSTPTPEPTTAPTPIAFEPYTSDMWGMAFDVPVG